MLSAFAVYNSKSELKNILRKKKLHCKSSNGKKKKTILKSKKRINELPNCNEKVSKQSKNIKKKIIKHRSEKCETYEKMVTNDQVSETKNFPENLILNEPTRPINCNKSINNKNKAKAKNNKKTNCTTKIDEVDSDTLKRPLDFLNYLIAPIRIPEFFKTYWETKPLHIVRNKTDYFKNILTSKQLDMMLRDNLLYYTKNVDVVTYENGERQTHNPEGRALPANIWDYYMNGCSIRIMNPQTYNQKIRDMLSALQEYFGTMVGVNVYLTPPGSQGFAPHYDDIEAFVIQLEGHKNWKLYAPRNEKEVLPRYSSHNLLRNELEAPLKELTLEAGDLLYFPRGFIHEAYTDDDVHSLHITVSVYQNTSYVDLLEQLFPQVLKTAGEYDVNFRKGLPLNYLQHIGFVNANKNSPERKEILSNVKNLLCKLVDYATVDTAADQLGRKFMYDALPPHLSLSERERSCKEDGDRMDNGIITNVVSFSPDTMIRFTRYYSQRLVIENDSTRIYYCTENANIYHGEEEQYLELDHALIETIKALHNTYPQYISIENLPGNDEVKKIQAISDLWEKGLIITRKPLDIEDE